MNLMRFNKAKCEVLHLGQGTHSPEGQPYPGLHQKQRGQQGEGGNSAPLLHPGETPPGVLHPVLEPSAQAGHGAAGAGPEDGHKDDPRAGASLL